MTKRKKKRLSAAIAGVMAAVMLLSNLTNFKFTVEASDKMMPGIETIVNGNKLNILEIVTEESDAEIGAYASGQEPWIKLYKEKVTDTGGSVVYEKRGFASLEEGLKSLPSQNAALAAGETGADVRKAFAEGTAMYEKDGSEVLQFIEFFKLAGDDLEKAPFGFKEYEEAYFPKDPDSWKKVALDRVQQVEIKGSYQEAAGGDYTQDDRDYYPVADAADQGKAEFKENILGFEFQNDDDKPYTLEFTPVLQSAIASGEALEAVYHYKTGGYGYYENIYNLVNLLDSEAVAKFNPADKIYRVKPDPLPNGLLDYTGDLAVGGAVATELLSAVWKSPGKSKPGNFNDTTNQFTDLTYENVQDIITATKKIIADKGGKEGYDVPDGTYPDKSIVQDADGVCRYYVWQRRPAGDPIVDTSGNVVMDSTDMLYVEGKQMVPKADVKPDAPDNYYHAVTKVQFSCTKDSLGAYTYTGTYSAIIPDGEEPYVKVAMGSGNFYASDPIYTLTPGKGNYTFVPDDAGALTQVPIHFIYYRGGFQNYDWFKRHILRMDPGDGTGDTTVGSEEAKLAMAQFAGFEIKVDTMTMEQLTDAAKELWNKDTTGSKPAVFDESMYLKQLLKGYQLVLAGGEIAEVQAVALFAGAANQSLSLIVNSDRAVEDGYVGFRQLAGWLTYDNKASVFAGLTGEDGEYPAGSLIEAKLNSEDGIRELKKASHYVLENVYYFSGKDKTGTSTATELNGFVSRQLHTEFLDDLAKTKFKEITEYINTENALREIENAGKPAGEKKYDLLDKKLSQARAVEYILNYSYRRNVGDKNTYNILELEPSDAGTEETLTRDQVRSWVGPRSDDKDDIPATGKRIYTDGEVTGFVWELGSVEEFSGFEITNDKYAGIGAVKVDFRVEVSEDGVNFKQMDTPIINFEYEKQTKTIEFTEKARAKWMRVFPVIKNAELADKGSWHTFLWDLTCKFFNKTIVNIHRMSTSEFAGKIGDLNSQYDLIYVGSDTSNKKYFDKFYPYSDEELEREGRIVGKKYPRYLETVMNGMIYVHVGDAIVDDYIKRVGLMDNDYAPESLANADGKKYMYSKSLFGLRSEFDTTIDRYVQKTQNFTVTNEKKSQEVTVGNLGIFRKSGNDITPIAAEKLVEFALSGYPIITEDDLLTVSKDGAHEKTPNSYVVDNTSSIYSFLDQIKNLDNTFTMSQMTDDPSRLLFYLNLPKPYLDFGKDDSGLPPIYKESDKQYINTSDKSLEYTFQIQDDSIISHEGETYHCQLFVDLNTDGNFATDEEVDDVIVRDEYNNLIPKQADGKYTLKVRTTYKVSRVLPSAYREIINWKLQVSSNNNGYIRTSSSGMSKLKQNERADVKVLQIMPEGFASWNLTTNRTVADWDKEFSDLLAGVEEFNFIVESITVPEYIQHYKDGNTLAEGIISGGGEPDMLILGFSDFYQNIENDKGAVDDILKFINNGKSVLFAHDNVSFINYTSDEIDMTGTIGVGGIKRDENNVPHAPAIPGLKNWGYEINKTLRQVLGMDRFGITYPETKDILNDNKILSEGDPNWAGVKDNTEDMAYVAGSKGRLQTYSETQGYNNLMLEETGKTDIETTTVTQVNEGVITKYPYELDPTFEVAPTHAQYYQLSLEQDYNKDKESDIVVWYALGGSNYTQNDARNNYYIYSNGNVMYTGVGHVNDKTNPDRKITTMEKKLFVNTIVAAYHSGVNQPAINFIENGDFNSDKKQYEYYSTDMNQNIDDNIIQKERDIYFRVFDYNLKSSDEEDGRNLDLKFYVKPESGEGTLSWNEITKSEGKGPEYEDKMYNLLPESAYTLEGLIPEPGKVKSGEVYKMKLNDISTLLRNAGGYQNKCELYATVSGESLTYGKLVEMFGSDNLIFRKQQLSNLD